MCVHPTSRIVRLTLASRIAASIPPPATTDEPALKPATTDNTAGRAADPQPLSSASAHEQDPNRSRDEDSEALPTKPPTPNSAGSDVTDPKRSPLQGAYATIPPPQFRKVVDIPPGRKPSSSTKAVGEDLATELAIARTESRQAIHALEELEERNANLEKELMEKESALRAAMSELDLAKEQCEEASVLKDAEKSVSYGLLLGKGCSWAGRWDHEKGSIDHVVVKVSYVVLFSILL